MGSLSNLYISQSYTSLAHLGTNNALVPGTMTVLQDGIGQSLNISFDGTNISSSGNIYAANITASVVNTGSLVSTASFNAYTSSTNNRLNNLENTSASVNVSISNLNSTTQSLNTSITNLNASSASQQISINSLNTFSSSALVSINNINSTTASLNSSVTQLNASSASQQISIDSLNTNSASVNTSITNINSATSSLFESASLSLVTASVSGQTLTFTKGNNSTFSVTLPTGSGGGSTDTGSLMVTGSVAVNVLTFTKGDGSTFDLTVAASGSAPEGTVSSSAQILNYGIFATTGSNTFRGNQIVSGSLRVTGSIIGSKVGAYDFDSIFLGSQLGGTTANGTFFGYGSTDYTFTVGAYAGGFDNELQTFVDSSGIYLKDFNGSGYSTFLKLLPNSGTNPKPIMTRGLEITGSTNIAELTASLQQGYVWVGNASGRTTTVATSSFGGGGTINTGSFATTGSNTFVGDQTINAKLIVSGSSNSYIQFSSPNSATGSGAIFFGNNGSYIQTYSAGSNPDNQGLQLVAGLSGSFALATRYAGPTGEIDLQALVEQGVSNQQSRLRVRAGSGISGTSSGNISLSGSSTIIQNLTYPSADGTNGQVITTNGSGVLTFTSVGGINTGSFATTGSNTFVGNQIITGSFRALIPTASSESQVNLFRLPTFVGANGTTYSTANVSLQDYGSSGIDQSFAIEYANDSFEKYTSLFVGPTSAGSVTKFTIGTGTGYDFDEISLTDNGNNTSTSVIKADTIQISGSLRVSGSSSFRGLVDLTGSLNINGANKVGFGTTPNDVYINSPFNGVTNSDLNIINYNIAGGKTNIDASNGLNLSAAGTGINISGNTRITGSTTITGSTAVLGTLTSTFNQPANNSQVDNLKVNSFADKYGYTLTNNTLGWQRYEGTVEGWVQELYTSDYAYGSSTRHEASGMTWEIYPSGSAYESNLVSLQGNSNGTTTFKVIADTTQITGSLRIQSGSGMPSQIGTSLVTWNSATGQIGQATTTTLISSSFSAGEFYSMTTLSGSAGVSASIALPNTAISNGVSIQSGSQIVVQNNGTYNIQFSAQVDAFSNADTIWIWFKKNGTNIADSASKLIMQNNTAAIMTVNIFDNGVPNDYYEVVWQNNAGHGKITSDAATGNIPGIPSVIVTVNQVK